MALPLLASAYDCQVDGIYYNLIPKGNAAEVTSGDNQYTGDVVIPEKFTYKGVEYSVTTIGESAFRSCYDLTSVTIPNSVTSIGDWAFAHCSGLTYMTIPNSVTYIGYFAFQDCTGLTSVTIPNSVTSIGNSAFSGCTGLTSVTIPNSVTSIGDGAFGGCSGLTSVAIPNSVTSIGNSAFKNCSGLTSVTIPNSVTSIGEMAFGGCDGLTSIKVESGNTVYDSRNDCNAIIETASNTLVAGCKNTVIPNSVTSIGNSAFSGCTCLTSVTIPNSVTSIGKYAFNGCSGLTSVTISNSVTSIGDGAFQLCVGLTSVTIPNSVTSIGDLAFRECSGLTSVTIPNSVTSIGGRAFYLCSSLTSVISEMENPCSIDTECFQNEVFYNATLYVPKGTVDKYKSTNYWNKFVFIEESDPTDIIQVSSDDMLISAQNGTITVRGEQNGLPLTVYTADGKMLGSATIMDGQASIATNLQRGEIAIVKVGKRSVKVKM